MTYNDLKKITKENKNFQQFIYVCNLFTCSYEIICNTRVSLYRNAFGKYVVTKWTDYEYQRYSEQNFFSDKDLAADYAWKLFGGDEEYKKFLDNKK